MRPQRTFCDRDRFSLAKLTMCGILCLLCAAVAPSAWCQLDAPLANYDQQRTGGYPGEVSLNPGNVPQGLGLFGLVGSYQGIDNCIYAHPLYVHNVMISGWSQPQNVIFILTTNGSIYVFNADQPFNLLDSITGFGQFANNPQNGDVRNCPDNGLPGPTGVLGTPVVDRANNRLWYVIDRDDSGTQTGLKRYVFVAYNYSTHLNDMAIDVMDPGGAFMPGQQTQRTGMLYNYSNPPYFSFGFSSTRSDQSPWQGWVFTYTYSCNPVCAQQLSNAVNLSPNSDGAGVWMSGGGIAWDGSFQYFTTGNGPAVGGDFPNSLGQLTIPGAFVNALPAPGGQAGDADLGSGRAIAVPGMNIVLAAGKAGNLYLLDTTSFSLAAPVQPVCPDTTQNGALFAGFAEWNRDVYTWCARDNLKKFHLSDLLSNNLAPIQLSQETAMNDAGANIGVSGTGGWGQPDGSNGIVWATYGTIGRFGPGIFAAYDANTGGLLF